MPTGQTGPTKQSAPRFVFPSSSKPDLQTPAPRKRFNQTLSSGPSQPSLSQFASTPRFGVPASNRKHVQWQDDHGIQDPGSSPPLTRPRPHLSSSKAGHDDSIDDALGEEISYADNAERSTPISRCRDDLGEEYQLPTGSTKIQQAKFNDFQDSRKRRRLDTPSRALIWLSSSSSPSPPRGDSEDDHEFFDEGHASSPDLPSPTLATGSLPRFKRPDITATTDNEPVSIARPSFRLPSHSNTGSLPSNTLPEVFSPSRRRGKGKDYIPGGMADTMRNWIVGLTTEDRHHMSHTSAGDDSQYTRTVRAVAIERDRDHKCTLTRCDDGKLVMFIGNGGSFRDQEVNEGSFIGIKGSRMSWSFDGVPFLGRDLNEGMMISILWDVLEP